MTEKARKYLLIINPAGGSGTTRRHLPEIERLLIKGGAEYDIHQTPGPDRVGEVLKTHGADFDVIVSLGGDGTVNEILNAMDGLEKPLGVIPLGTGNDFARSCNIPVNSLKLAIDVLLNHEVRMLDVGEVNGRRFINMVGIGFEGRANNVSRKLGFIRGQMKYMVAIAAAFVRHKAGTLRVTLDGESFEEDVYTLAVGNGWNTGGGLKLTPHARLDDGLLDILCINRITRMRVLTNLKRLEDGSITEIAEASYYQAKTVRIESEEPFFLQHDGEQCLPNPRLVDIRILPKVQAVVGNWEAERN